MSLASLFGGLALANAKLGAVHGFAGPLGGMFHGVAHGAICAALLPAVMRANVRALRQRAADAGALEKFEELGELLAGRDGRGADAAVCWVEGLCRDLGVRGLGALGVDLGRRAQIVAKAKAASSMRGNPIDLTDEEMGAILDAAA
jgi:alcohol dehydrogenase class IV